MAAQEPSLSLEQDPTQPLRRPPASLSELREDVHPLGEALKARAEDVLELTARASSGRGHEVDAVVQDSFERINRSSTIAVARWIAGEGVEVAIEAGKETWVDLRRAGGSSRGVAEPGDETLPVVARLGGRGAARERRAAGRFARGALSGAEHAAAEPRVQPRADVQVL